MAKYRPANTSRRVDSFGTAQIGDHGAFRARLIQTDETEFALFPEDPNTYPVNLRFAEPPRIRGRVLSGTLQVEGPTDFAFARASCGCQTPRHLRGPARMFLAQLSDPEPDAMWTEDGRPVPIPGGVL
jgi:hypothetical protein